MTLSFVALDFETANSDQHPCSVGLVKVENSRIVAKEYRLINPECPIWGYFTKIHKIRNSDVRDEPCFDLVWQSLRSLLKGADFIAAHNAPFDRHVLEQSCHRYGMRPPSHDFVYSLSLSRQALDLPGYSLKHVCKHFDLKVDHHQALSDAVAFARIVVKLKKYI